MGLTCGIGLDGNVGVEVCGTIIGRGFDCNRCIVVDLCCDCEACSLDAPGVVTPDTAPDISEPN